MAMNLKAPVNRTHSKRLAPLQRPSEVAKRLECGDSSPLFGAGSWKADAPSDCRLAVSLAMCKAFTVRCLLIMALVAGALTAAAGAEESPGARSALDFFLVVTGGELLEGAYPDGHTHFLTRTLRLIGLRCVGSLTVDDRADDIQNALRFATNHARLVLVTGGLGPTPNDITRETLSEFTGVPLREDEAVLQGMERRFGQTRDQLRANLRKQCLVPAAGGHLRNGSGTAVGLIFQPPGYVVVALPGPPRELQPMVRDELVPWLQQHCGAHVLGSSITLRFVGVGQSQITQTLQERVTVPEDIVVTSLFEGSRVDFTFTSIRNGPDEAQRLKGLGAALREPLAEYFYADDGSTLEEIVLRELQRRGLHLALAEVTGGGALGASLGGAPEATRVLSGSFAAPTGERLARLVEVPASRWQAASTPEEQSKALVEAAAARVQAEWAVALGEGRPAGDTLEAWLAIKAGDRCFTQRLSLRAARPLETAGYVTSALDRLRRILRETP